MKVLMEFEKTLKGDLNSFELRKAYRELNLHFFNDEDCNKYDESGSLVAKYPELETLEVKNAYWCCKQNFYIKVIVQLMEDGTFKVREK